MQPLLDLNLTDMWWADNNVELLTNGNFEGAAGPPPAGWSLFHSVMTREAGTRTGGSGSYVGRVAYDGVNAAGIGYEAACTVGRRYHALTWMKSDGVGIPTLADGVGGTYWTGLASVTWQGADTILTASSANMCLMCNNLAAGRYIDADDLSLQEQFMYTRNRGLLGQTPATQRVQVGDGRTAASFPTMLNLTQSPRKGMSFDGANQYLQYNTPIPSGTYTFCMLAQRGNVGASSRLILDCRASGGSGDIYLSAGLSQVIADGGGTVYMDNVAAPDMSLGRLYFVAVAGITLSAPGVTYFFRHNAAAANIWLGNVFGLRLDAGTLTPRQLSDVRQRMLAEIYSP